MESNKLRNHIQIRKSRVKTREDIMKLTITLSIENIGDVARTRDIEENKISVAFENYTKDSDITLYKNSYRPDSSKFKINPNENFIDLNELIISKDTPKKISPWSNFEFTIVIENYSYEEDDIRLIPYIDGISVSNSKHIKLVD